MDISKYAVGPESYDSLSHAQIRSFFSDIPVTRAECDNFASQLSRGLVAPTPIQGGSSYTLIGKEAASVIQFRSSRLDDTKLELVHQTYPKFAPSYRYHGTRGPLHIYQWELVHGQAFCRVRREMFNSTLGVDPRLKQAVQDFARFSASAWTNRMISQEKKPLGLQTQYVAILDELMGTLPNALHSTIDMVKSNLHLLFRADYPSALQHGDLLENNIHVDELDGHITGLLDWADAFVAPFGLSLGGAEILFGIQTHTDWHLHPSHVELRREFWDTFYSEIGEVSDLDKRSMEVARLMGLFETHGFEPNGKSGVYLQKLIL